MEKPYDRKPIILGPHNVAVLHIFSRTDKFEDMWMQDFWEYMGKHSDDFEDNAKQLINQLEDHWCLAFIMALMKECMKKIIEDDEMCNSLSTRVGKEDKMNRAGEMIKQLTEMINIKKS